MEWRGGHGFRKIDFFKQNFSSMWCEVNNAVRLQCARTCALLTMPWVFFVRWCTHVTYCALARARVRRRAGLACSFRFMGHPWVAARCKLHNDGMIKISIWKYLQMYRICLRYDCFHFTLFLGVSIRVRQCAGLACSFRFMGHPWVAARYTMMSWSRFQFGNTARSIEIVPRGGPPF